MMHSYLPIKPEDFGKALVWSFIAGFSERLVPDLLQSLVAKQGKGEEVIMPHATRLCIARALAMLRHKHVEMPARKHDNLPV